MFQRLMTGWALVLVVLAFFWLPASRAEKIKFSTSVKLQPNQILPPMAAEEKGFWKEEGLDVEWIPFDAGGAQHRAIAAGSIETGIGATISLMQAIARGVPMVLVADLGTINEFSFYVRKESSIKEARDLKGTRIGVTRFGGATHAYGQLVARALGLAAEIRFISQGTLTNQVAALKAGVSDAEVLPDLTAAPLQARGEVRRVIEIQGFLPSEWSNHTVLTQKEFGEKHPEKLKRIIKGVFRATEFILKNPSWAKEKMKASLGYTDPVADTVFAGLHFGKGTLSPKAIENIRTFLIDYGILKGKVPPAEEFYTTRFIP